MHDLIIVGGGPAGYTAGIYAARYLLDTVVLAEKKRGTLMDSPLVENYPGFKSLSGYDLGGKLEAHLLEYPVPVKEERVLEAEKTKEGFHVKTNMHEYQTKALILATGWKRRKLKAEGADKYDHKGISYCATCDAALYGDKTVAVVGGGDAGIGAALLLSGYANKIYVIEMLDRLAAEPIKLEKIKENDKIEVITGAEITKVKGDTMVNALELSDGRELFVEGIFVEIGGTPNIKLAEDLDVGLDQKQNIIIDNSANTNVPGVFAAGDVTDVPLKQAVVAAGQGAIAAWSAYKYITE